MGRNETVKVAGVTVRLEPLIMGTCTYLKERITTAAETNKQAIQCELKKSAEGAAQEINLDFQHWLKEIVAAKVLYEAFEAEDHRGPRRRVHTRRPA